MKMVKNDNIIELCKNNKKPELTTALSNGANVNQQNFNGETALFISCQKNYADLVMILLQQRNIDVNLQDKYNWTPLHVACNEGNVQVVKLLLNDARINVNLTDNDGWTALMRAACWGRTKTTQWLLSFWATVDLDKKTTKDSDGDTFIQAAATAMDIAKKRGENKIVSILEEYKNDPIECRNKIRQRLGLQGGLHSFFGKI